MILAISTVGHAQPQRKIESDHQGRTSTPEYTITPITEHQELYYESHGQLVYTSNLGFSSLRKLKRTISRIRCIKVSLSQNSTVLYRSFRT